MVRKAPHLAPLCLCMLLAALVALSCSHKRTAHIERTHADTLVTARTDSQAHADTAQRESHTYQADSMRESVTTFVVIDSTGKVKTAYVWHTKQTVHNKNALEADHHTSATSRQTAEAAKQSTAVRTAEQVTVRQSSAPKRLLLCIIIPILALAAFYLYTYKKRKSAQ